jgi:hypothetical protein
MLEGIDNNNIIISKISKLFYVLIFRKIISIYDIMSKGATVLKIIIKVHVDTLMIV